MFGATIDQSIIGLCAPCVDCVNIALSYNHYEQTWMAASSGIQI